MNSLEDYTGMSLTPTLFSELLIKHFDGYRFKRMDALSIINDYFTSKGGEPPKDIASVFKSASHLLQKKGFMKNIGYGMWELQKDATSIELYKEENEHRNNENDALIVMGSGKESVYVYYFDAYKTLAELTSDGTEVRWPIEIGKTKVSIPKRVKGQIGICLPEKPKVVFEFKCEDSSVLETALHSMLTLKGFHIDTASGIGWFNTNPPEILEVYQSVIAICGNKDS